MLSRRMMLIGVMAPAIVRASSLDRLPRRRILTPTMDFPDEIMWDIDAVNGIRITAMRFYGSRTWIPVTGRIPLQFTDTPDFPVTMFQRV
jgi:hypothetical protein